MVDAERRVGRPHHRIAVDVIDPLETRADHRWVVGPGVPEPERRQELQPGSVGPPIGDRHRDEQVVGSGLRVLHDHVEVPVVVEHAGVDQLVLEVVPAPGSVGGHEVLVGVCRLRVLVEVPHVRVGRRVVEVEVVLLDVLAVVALAVRETEQPLLEDGIGAVPQRECEAQLLVVVGDAGQAVLSPPVGPRPGLVVRERVPRIAVRHCRPRAPSPIAAH